MTKEQINYAIMYIRTHTPRETDLETIDVAIRAIVSESSAATREDMVNPDDAWLIPDEERQQFAGIKGKGWAQSFDEKTIQAFKEAVNYAKTHSVQKNTNNQIDDITELKSLKNELLNTNIFNDEYISNKKK